MKHCLHRITITAALTLVIAAPSMAQPDEEITRVRTVPLTDLIESRQRDVPATLVARNSPELAAEITALIQEIPVRVGDVLKAGDSVARLDCRITESRLAGVQATKQQLIAQRDFSASQLRRSEDLKAKRGISDELVEQRASELASLEAQLIAQEAAIEQARIDAERCDVKAPFAAVVTARLANVGGLAVPGTPLVRLVELSDLEVSAAFREEEATSLANAKTVVFRYQGKDHALNLRTLVPVVDGRARTREARFALADGTEDIPAGATGRVVWSDSTPMLPAQFLVRRNGQLGVFLVNDERAHFHAVPTALEGQPAVVDLPENTRLVSEGRHGLADGDAVMDADAVTSAALAE